MPPVMVKDCAVGLARISAMDEDGVSSSDALSLDCQTIHDEHVVLFLPPDMGTYLAVTCRRVHREAARRRGNSLFFLFDVFAVVFCVGLLVAYVLVGFLHGFAYSTRTVAMGLGFWYVVTVLAKKLFGLALDAGVRCLTPHRRPR